MDFNFDSLLNQNEVAQKLVISISVVLVLYLFRMVSHRLITKLISHVKNRYFWRQTLHYLIVVLGGVLLFNVWADWFRSVFTLLTLIAAALTIVSKEVILNLLGYIIILSRYMFHVGDRIQIGAFKGVVVEIGPFYISLAELGPNPEDDFTGRILKVPNGLVFTNTIANASKGSPLIWHEIRVNLKLTSSIENYFKLIDGLIFELAEPVSEEDQDALKQINEEIIFLRTQPERTFKVVDDVVQIKIRMLCKVHKVALLEKTFWEKFIRANLEEPNVYDAIIKPSLPQAES